MFPIHLFKKKIHEQTNRPPMSLFPVYTGAYEQMTGPDAPT